jgi:CRISPR-associated protein Cpf1
LHTYGTRIYSCFDKASGNWTSKEIELTEEFKKLFGENYETVSVDFVKSQNTKDFFIEFLRLFKLMLSLRNSKTGTDIDYMISPVENNFGENFDSRKVKTDELPKNADANGAYNIARKGLMLLKRLEEQSDEEEAKFDYKVYTIQNKDYLKFLQEK